MLILHPFLSNKHPRLAQLPQILLGPPWDAQVTTWVRKVPGLLGACRYADLVWSLGPSLSPTNLLLVLLAKESSESPQRSRAPHGSRTLRSGIQSDSVSQNSQEVSSGPSTHSHTHTHPPHTSPVDGGTRERLRNKGGFHPEPAERGRPWQGLQPRSRVPSCDSELKNV